LFRGGKFEEGNHHDGQSSCPQHPSSLLCSLWVRGFEQHKKRDKHGKEMSFLRLFLLSLFVAIVVCAGASSSSSSRPRPRLVVPKSPVKQLVSSSSSSSLPYLLVAQQSLFLFSAASVANAAASAKSTKAKPIDLRRRVESEDAQLYEPGITASDVFYPSYFRGTWNSSSICTSIVAPLSIASFGGQRVYDQALQDVGVTLNYLSRFVTSTMSEEDVVADRLFNVLSIAKASMGEESILDSKQPDVDLARRLHLTVSPAQDQGSLFDIDLIPTDRIFTDNSDKDTFAVLERTTQLISVRIDALSRNPPPPRRKEIETTTVYKRKSDDVVEATQRTATFLSMADPRFKKAFELDERVKFTAVDIRKYKVTYTRLAAAT